VFVNIVHETQQSIDTGMCVNATLVLQARPADSYLWSNGDTLSHTIVSLPGNYSVKRAINGCKLIDSFLVINYPTPTSSVLDTIICKGTPVQLKAGAANTYQWNTADTTAHIIVVAAGIYYAIKQVPPCQGIDTFRVQHYILPQITSVTDTTVCFDEVKQILLDAGQFAKYLWQPTGETTRTIYSNTAQVYKLTVTDSNTCVSSKEFAVMEECPYSLYIPNAFTPNNDGINDVLVIKGNRIDSFRMMVINRWGQIVFETTRMDDFWTGQGCSNDVYTLIIEYSALGKTNTYKGTVTVLR
jgi:gliding motility-associated-like protein